MSHTLRIVKLELKDGRTVIQTCKNRGPAFQFGCVILYDANWDGYGTPGEYTYYPFENVLSLNVKETFIADIQTSNRTEESSTPSAA